MLILLIGLIFSLIAAIMAYLTTYAEYERHFPDRRKARNIALESAVVFFIFFVILTIALAVVFGNGLPSLKP
jgi:purine-cytosine permease-like protein